MVFDHDLDPLTGSRTVTPARPAITAYGSLTGSPAAAAAVLRAAASRFDLPLAPADPGALAVAALLAHCYAALTGGQLTAPARHGAPAVAVVSRSLQLAAGTSRPAPADPDLLEDLLLEYASFNDTDQSLVAQLWALALHWAEGTDADALVCSLCIELLDAAPNSVFTPLAAALADALDLR